MDLFCGAGGLTRGLQSAGIKVVAGIDVDAQARFAFEHNNKSLFIQGDVRYLNPAVIRRLYPRGSVRILAGCAPCNAYSTLRNGRSIRSSKGWKLLDSFGNLVDKVRPDIVTMENVAKLSHKPIFRRFISRLRHAGYRVTFDIIDCARMGIPQRRRRLVLLASRLGEIKLPEPSRGGDLRTVRDAIGTLPPIEAGASSPRDRLHRSAGLRLVNLRRIKASKPGGSWKDWNPKLRLECHRRGRGPRFTPVYGRMEWDAPSPTITTKSFNLGSGRFGHPSQRRAISLREAALLQTFPRGYQFTPRREPVKFKTVGRLIGNAVPVKLGRKIGVTIVSHVNSCFGDDR